MSIEKYFEDMLPKIKEIYNEMIFDKNSFLNFDAIETLKFNLKEQEKMVYINFNDNYKVSMAKSKKMKKLEGLHEQINTNYDNLIYYLNYCLKNELTKDEQLSFFIFYDLLKPNIETIEKHDFSFFNGFLKIKKDLLETFYISSKEKLSLNENINISPNKKITKDKI